MSGVDPGALASAFLAGPTLISTDINVNTDLIPYFRALPNGEYEMCVVSPAELYIAMST